MISSIQQTLAKLPLFVDVGRKFSSYEVFILLIILCSTQAVRYLLVGELDLAMQGVKGSDRSIRENGCQCGAALRRHRSRLIEEVRVASKNIHLGLGPLDASNLDILLVIKVLSRKRLVPGVVLLLILPQWLVNLE